MNERSSFDYEFRLNEVIQCAKKSRTSAQVDRGKSAGVDVGGCQPNNQPRTPTISER